MGTWRSSERLNWTRGTPIVLTGGRWGLAPGPVVHAVVSGRIDEYTISFLSSGIILFASPTGVTGADATAPDGTVFGQWQSPTKLVLLPSVATAGGGAGGAAPLAPDYALASDLTALTVRVAALETASVPDITNRIWFGA